ncbi:MAG: DUF2339 domain-containing protein [Marinilabiliales bacterium]|nr:DUF2339 domain-containing protein [Marinilabiliales bacterium]
MKTEKEELEQLNQKLELLLKRQKDFSMEIDRLRFELDRLKRLQTQTQKTVSEKSEIVEIGSGNTSFPNEETPKPEPVIWRPSSSGMYTQSESASGTSDRRSSLEKFIGENLINKIGIAITVIGVSIGVKYAIDHDLISPLTRILLGYLFGFILFGFSVKLRKQYLDFSAVLLSGSMAILYFMTYAAYSFYGLLPQVAAFFLMVVFTAITVSAALFYQRQVIAHIGMVGAYAVPFLLGDKSSHVTILFSYVTLINSGILVIAFYKFWKPLYIASFTVTWLIYLFWFATSQDPTYRVGITLLFLFLFFAIFYGILLVGKLLRQKEFEKSDLILLLANSSVFFGCGYALLHDHETGKQLLGLFTFGNALIHFGVSAVIFFRSNASKHLFYLVSALGLTFLTIAIPVQLDGHWVTLLWSAEAAFLFWLGRSRSIPAYEQISYPLMILAFGSLLTDWSTYHQFEIGKPETWITPLFNPNFLTSLLFLAAFTFIHYINGQRKYLHSLMSQKMILKTLTVSISVVLLLSLYLTFYMEIATYWNQLFVGSKLSFPVEGQHRMRQSWNNDYLRYKTIWLILYSLLFVSSLTLLNLKRWKNRLMGRICFGLLTFVLLIYLSGGQLCLGQLREGYLGLREVNSYALPGQLALWFRYLSLLFVVGSLWVLSRLASADYLKKRFGVPHDLILSVTLLWLASSELIHWMDLLGYTESYKLGLSILWGLFSLSLIGVGIGLKKRHLRIGAIVWFGITLIKLFFYDISYLDTLSKTIVFVSLGILLLIISFLYNKYAHRIAGETQLPEE